MTFLEINAVEVETQYNDIQKWIPFILIESLGLILTLCLLMGIIRFIGIRELLIVQKRYPKMV